MQPIICRKCKAEKAPCLFTPADVKNAVRRPDGKLVSVCRACRKQVRASYSLKAANAEQKAWRVSMRAIFARDAAAIPQNRRI